MLLYPDGTFKRDIDIDELRICCGEHYGKTIILTKNKISYQNTIHPTIGYMDFPQNYFEIHEMPVSYEQFQKLSDDIHEAGLLNLFHKTCDRETSAGAIYQTLHCLFDDGSEYAYMTRATADKKFTDIVEILLSFCGILQNEEILYEEIPYNEQTKIETACNESKCCNALVLSHWLFCPECGQNLTVSDFVETDKFFDVDKTIWLCENCKECIPLEYQYCGKCGRKRPW